MPELIQALAPLGIGGILAAFIFTVYRKDMRETNARWAGQSELLVEVIKENTAAITSLVEVVRGLKDGTHA